ncbi:MAG: hypothetical protein LKE96_02800 [Acetobacter peroxydans]|jgi:hypothetical protein|nr:hypothetical protein [Acetobacter peroxydans]
MSDLISTGLEADHHITGVRHFLGKLAIASSHSHSQTTGGGNSSQKKRQFIGIIRPIALHKADLTICLHPLNCLFAQ